MQPPAFGNKAATRHQTFADLYAQDAPRKDWADAAVEFLFDARGRVSRHAFRRARLGFILVYLGLWLFGQVMTADAHAVAAHATGAPSRFYVLAESLTLLAVIALTCWCGGVITVKRWHDLDKSGVWALLGFIPIAGWIGQTVMCSFSNGTPGPNRFGPAPR
jgi:uncharacterized membrane protein YhaH (DUF805 family)